MDNDTQDNPASLNVVLSRQAEHLFNNKKYLESAVCYAQTQSSFEEVCLKFLEIGDFTALRTFLTHKLRTLDAEREITQTTVVVAYIIEIFLNQLADLAQDRRDDECDALRDEFHRFLDNSLLKVSCHLEIGTLLSN